MELKIKRSKENQWGFVESFKKWKYFHKVGYVEVITSIGSDGNFTKPYVFRGEEFIPLKVIEEEMGVEKYLKAKKPFYSILSDGFVVVKMRVYVNFETGEYLEEKSSYDVYSVVGFDGEKVAFTKRIREIPTVLDSCIKKLMKDLSTTEGSREKFLVSRL